MRGFIKGDTMSLDYNSVYSLEYYCIADLNSGPLPTPQNS